MLGTFKIKPWFYFEGAHRKPSALLLINLTLTEAPFISHSRIQQPALPSFLSAWKHGCSGGGEELRPAALPQLRGGLLVPGAVRTSAGSSRDDFPADGEVSAGHHGR